MFELEPEAFERILPIVPPPAQAGHMAFAHAVIEGSMPGFILVDDARKPSAAIVGNLCGFWHAIGTPDADLAGAAAPGLKARVPENEPTSLWCATPAWEALFDGYLDEKRWRYEYHFEGLPAGTPPVPAGMELRPIDASIAGKFAGRVDPWVVNVWGGPRSFAERSFGFALLDEGGEIASFCAACAIQADGWDGEVEIEIGTARAFRKQGLAAIVGAAFISECARRRLKPAWTCAADNEASRRSAACLGFKEFRRVAGYVLLAGPGEPPDAGAGETPISQ